MKVIWQDGFNREQISDRLIQSNLGECEAEDLARELNAQGSEGDYYRVVDDDYVLYVFEP